MAIVRRTAVGRASVPEPVIPQQPGAAPASLEMAASAPTPAPKGWAVLTGFGLTALGGLGAWDIGQVMQPTSFPIAGAPSAFAALFVFAAAVERLVEPLTRFMPGRDAQAAYERALADMDNGVPGAVHAAAYHKAAADSARASRGIIMWGIATLLATLLAAGAGFYLLRMISADPGWNGVSRWVDALVTGLVVGSGTKPLHDLFTRVQGTSS